MKLDVALHSPFEGAPAEAHQLTAAGFNGLFTFEGRTDPFLPLACTAARAEIMGSERTAETSNDLLLYTNIAVALPRSPLQLAQVAFDIQRATNGRFALGLGSQIRPHIERRFSATWGNPVERMTELVDATRSIMRRWQHRQPINYKGKYYTHTLDAPLLTPAPLVDCTPPPVWLAAVRPRMTQAAATVADGIITHPFASAHHLRTVAKPQVDDVLSAREPVDAFTFVAGVMVAMWREGSERQGAMDGLRAQLGFYGSTPAYRVVLDSHGWGDLQPELRRLTRTGRWADLGSVFSDSQAQEIAVTGTPAEVAHELSRRYCGLADRLSLQVCAGTKPGHRLALAQAFRDINRDRRAGT